VIFACGPLELKLSAVYYQGIYLLDPARPQLNQRDNSFVTPNMVTIFMKFVRLIVWRLTRPVVSSIRPANMEN
jgi:hypothetical protein